MYYGIPQRLADTLGYFLGRAQQTAYADLLGRHDEHCLLWDWRMPVPDYVQYEVQWCCLGDPCFNPDYNNSWHKNRNSIVRLTPEIARNEIFRKWLHAGGIRGWLHSLPQAQRWQSVTVWRFDEAPLPLQALSINGGDEDWLVYVPNDRQFSRFGVPCWVEAMDANRDPDCITIDDYTAVYIGSHAW